MNHMSFRNESLGMESENTSRKNRRNNATMRQLKQAMLDADWHNLKAICRELESPYQLTAFSFWQGARRGRGAECCQKVLSHLAELAARSMSA